MSDKMSNRKEENAMKKRTKIIVIGCLCLLLAGVLAGIRLLTPSDKTETA